MEPDNSTWLYDCSVNVIMKFEKYISMDVLMESYFAFHIPLGISTQQDVMDTKGIVCV